MEAFDDDLSTPRPAPAPSEVPMRIVQLELMHRAQAREIQRLMSERSETTRWLRGVVVAFVLAALGGLGTLVLGAMGYGRLLEQSENTAEAMQELRVEVRSLRGELTALRRSRRADE